MAKAEKSLYETIYAMVKKIPKGKVATYGQIARLCGLREHARLVGYALHNLKPNSGVPWHRVINSKGMISLPKHAGAYERQKTLLEKEGIIFAGEKINLSKYAPATLKRRVR
jgi:methylated-DNA-protein-cysteine methyltransferase related protein